SRIDLREADLWNWRPSEHPCSIPPAPDSQCMIKGALAYFLRAPSPKQLGRSSGCQNAMHYVKRCLPFVLLSVLAFIVIRSSTAPKRAWEFLQPPPAPFKQPQSPEDPEAGPTIVVITPTHKRPERFADMTRFSQTLSHIKNLHWVVIEDANATSPAVERILQRSGLPYVYFHATTEPGMPKRGWTHRNRALQFVRENYKDYKRGAVVYFADDDNSYDIRLFDKYIRRVKRLGIWAVGLAGTAVVEAPRVANKTIVGWDVVFAPGRAFATDMAGFALNINEIVRVPTASFSQKCSKQSPETCFLAQFGMKKEEAEPFGFDDDPKEVLVWHTKTRNIGTRGSAHGYVVE
ncbi:hypothetical protein PMAYCL1PPCAC_09056, partial [Pristionchus mayeri]